MLRLSVFLRFLPRVSARGSSHNHFSHRPGFLALDATNSRHDHRSRETIERTRTIYQAEPRMETEDGSGPEARFSLPSTTTTAGGGSPLLKKLLSNIEYMKHLSPEFVDARSFYWCSYPCVTIEHRRG